MVLLFGVKAERSVPSVGVFGVSLLGFLSEG